MSFWPSKRLIPIKLKMFSLAILTETLGVESTFNIKEEKFSFNYLGTYIAPRRIRKEISESIHNQMLKKLSGWQTTYLSQAGRVTLMNNDLGATPIHILSVTWMCQSALDNIAKLQKIYFFSWYKGYNQSYKDLWFVFT